eukprot:TRINITY_DN3711_c1_g1_i1.p1 TRINITY_DN3711_c1_g1~~TRINITY_DN3711_c1_g1_i1.p1  ORF type:complete len:383 (+),score=37.61 TRINITY_DN3711_c1_g1_i1:57-1205(+)
MQIEVSCPQGFPDVVFTFTEQSTVREIAQAAADEWGTVAVIFDIYHSGCLLPGRSLLVSHGMESGSHVVASLKTLYSKDDLSTPDARMLVFTHCPIGMQITLDTDSFTDDGQLTIDPSWFEEDYCNRIITIKGSRHATSVCDNFFLRSPITDIDLSAISSVTSIGVRFLMDCKSLVELNMSQFKTLSSIGLSFCSGCDSLTKIDLSTMTSVTSIGDHFLHACSSLQELSMAGFQSLRCINKCFLYGCKQLTSLDLSGLVNVRSISDSFLGECSSLVSLDLCALRSVEYIGDYFLFRCASIEDLNLSCLKSVSKIGKAFLCYKMPDASSAKKQKFLKRVESRTDRKVETQQRCHSGQKAVFRSGPQFRPSGFHSGRSISFSHF